MRYRAAFLTLAIAAAALAALGIDSERRAPPAVRQRAEAAMSTDDDQRCRVPRVTGLTARWGGERGRRLKLRVQAAAVCGQIVALHATWGDGRTAIHELRARPVVSLTLAYSYRQAGHYGISVVVESHAPGGLMMMSAPAPLRVVVPLQRMPGHRSSAVPRPHRGSDDM